MKRYFEIIGVGMGTESQLTERARHGIITADEVWTTPRLSESLATLRSDIQGIPLSSLAMQVLKSTAEHIAILVSGDVGFFSAAQKLRQQFLPYGQVELVCGLSSLQYFCAQIGVSYHDILVVSLHGRSGSLVGAVSYNTRVFALTGGALTAQHICRELVHAGLGMLKVSIGENLGTERQCIADTTAQVLSDRICDDLAVILIENPGAVSCFRPLFDKDFLRGKVPMTKEEVRWVSTAKLGINPEDTVYDIGAGTGSVSLELARKACHGIVYAVERTQKALDLLSENRIRLGGYNVNIVKAEAPDGLRDLPAPDAVFIGGSGGNLRRIMQTVQQKNSRARIVVNAITLETLREAVDAFETLYQKKPDVIQIATTRGSPVGNYTMLVANNPVFIICGGGDDGA